jgi:hypothetical protein
MKKIGLFLSVLAIAVFFSASNVLADEGTSGESAKMLKEISEKQDRILQALEEMKSELNVIKIRISSR